MRLGLVFLDGPTSEHIRRQQAPAERGKHGPIPYGMVLKAFGPIGNPDPSNWVLISRDVCCHLAKTAVMAFNTAPAELQASMLALGKRCAGRTFRFLP